MNDQSFQTDLEPEEERPFTESDSSSHPASDEELEARYDSGTFRVITQLNNFLIPGLLQSLEEEQYINVHPDYQRRLRWDPVRRSLLIESLLMNVPIPPVFLYETDLAKYEVVDGQQRLAAIDDFFHNRMELRGLKYWPSLNRRRFGGLPSRLKQALLRRSITAVILLTESSVEASGPTTDVRRIVFERLNTGGERLNAQEVRNAVDSGPFNDLIHDLARHEQFTQAWGIPAHSRREEQAPSTVLSRNPLYRTMGDCELVLRYFALSDTSKLAGSLKQTLDNAMKTGNKASVPQLAEMREEFLSCLSLATEIYGDKAFRLPSKAHQRGRPSKALYDAAMLGLRHQLTTAGASQEGIRARLVAHRDAIQKQTESLLSDTASYSYTLLLGRLNTRDSIIERIELLRSLFAKVP